MSTEKRWHGSTICSNCGKDLRKSHGKTTLYDARSVIGLWGVFCRLCFLACTRGRLGLGIGQEYTKNSEGKFIKTGG